MDLDIISNILWLSLMALIALNRMIQCIKSRKKTKKHERRIKARGRGDS